MQLYFFLFVWDNIRACTCILNQTKLGCKMLRFRAESLDGIDLQETGRFSEKVKKQQTDEEIQVTTFESKV